ncbi:DUF6415 family natural product biosynthesis protein [Streptomyces sp. NPDC002082]|uniref:DUF6415 family natural product biosynthesis protein n=1 Tax=Streptomyces sp. NPDC002082 TaxID=3154772 RepID=UPI00332F1821
MAASHHGEVHDPEGLLDCLPLDRGPQLALATAALRWSSSVPAPAAADVELIALQLTGHARTVARELGGRVGEVAAGTPLRWRLEIVVDDANRRLAVKAPKNASVAHTQSRARLVVGLYRSLDEIDQHRCLIAFVTSAPTARAVLDS